jgi:cytochrome c oxidase subunit 2
VTRRRPTAERRPIRLSVGAVAAALAAAAVLASCGDDGGDPAVARGRDIAQDVGCLSCHSTGTSDGLGPGLGGIWGSERTFEDGTTAVVDEAYLRRSIREPDAQVVDGFMPIMPRLSLTDAELDDVVAYLRDVTGG